ncbi:MAG: T9SS type A sorting domain-containing protein [Saprospiraceae bacterium]|nr:T9SS type A sorting domain-containing protein [Saprospiraceae bacterium]
MFRHTFHKLALSLIAVFFLGNLAFGQTCTYTINMFEVNGFGWNGGVLTVVSDGVTTTHTLAFGTTGTSTFDVTEGASITITWTPGFFGFPTFELISPDNVVLAAEGNFGLNIPIPTGVVFEGVGHCPNCNAVDASLVTVPANQITDSTAFVNWPNQGQAEYWVVEYSPAGFPLGTGIRFQTTASQATLTDLNPCVEYDVYIATHCGVDSMSYFAGPVRFSTKYTPPVPPVTCDYTFNLFDLFGDGWVGGSALEVSHNCETFTYTFDDGLEANFTLEAVPNMPINVTFLNGLYPNEHSYEIVDPSGNIIFSDGPAPQIGEVFNTIACPTCAGPASFKMSDVNATNARFQWVPSPGATGTYTVEYGPMGFELGTGTSVSVPSGQLDYVNLTGLDENRWYNAYVKFNCGSDSTIFFGPAMFKTLWLNDLGVSGISMPTAGECNLSADQEVEVLLSNYGQKPQTLFEFYYAVNGQVAPVQTPQDGLFTGVLGNDSTQVIQFETNYDFSEPGIYYIQAWTVLDGDSQPHNDTFSTYIITAYPKPLKEDFEDNAIPTSWTADGDVFLPFSHENETYVFGKNLYAGNPSMELKTHRFGKIVTGDTLRFDYRYVNWSDPQEPTELGPDDQLEVQVSSDCEANWTTVFTVNSANHLPSTDFATKAVPLNAYNGKAINIRFLGSWGEGDYWLDLDNINLEGCPESLFIVGDVTGTVEGGSTGHIDLSLPFDQGPFTYSWTDDSGTVISTEEDPSDLPLGTYLVEVTSESGCSGTKTFNIGIFVGANEVEGVEQISLFPNPTAGEATVNVKLLKNMDVELRLFSTSGQLIFASQQDNTAGFNQSIDMSNQAPGMYFLQIIADGKPYHAKLVVAK